MIPVEIPAGRGRQRLTAASGRWAAGAIGCPRPGSGGRGEVAAADGSDLSRGSGDLQGSAGPGHAAPADLAGSGVEFPGLLRIGLVGGDDVYENQLIGHVDMMAGGCDILSS